VQSEPAAHVEPAPQRAPEAVQARAAESAPVETQQAETQHAAPAQPSPPPLKLEWPSDLVQVETDPGKVASAAAQPQPEAPPRRSRVRRAPPAVSNEPLVQVETSRGQDGGEHANA
jgi:hypothetical protein